MLILCFILAMLAAGLASDANPFYVTKITKGEKAWTFELKNHHAKLEVDDATNPELMLATAKVESLDQKVLHIKITNSTGKRWEAPIFNANPGSRYKAVAMDNMGFSFTEDPFTFAVTDPETKQPMFTIDEKQGGSLHFADKLIELGLWYPSKRIFGFGERSTPDLELCHARTNCKYTIFNKDALNPLDDGTPPGAKQTYGTHPFYMILLPNGKFMGAFFLNSNAQEAEITKLGNGAINLYHRTVGGVIDIYFFYPQSADSLMKQYHDLIGRPYIAPFWSLGYHQCRWGWKNVQKVRDVVANFEQSDIPLEVMWADIDYMLNYTDFTYDPKRYAELPDFVDELHKRKMKWVPIIDAGLNYSKSDKYIKAGEENNALIKSAVHPGQTFIGRVWPGITAYVDFLAPYGSTLWQMGLSDFYQQVKFDGVWLDMNEASNFCNGECDKEDLNGTASPYEETDTFADPDPKHDPAEFNNLPYTPGNRSLNHKAIHMAAYSYAANDDEVKFNKEYNLHSLWGIKQCRSTNDYLTKSGKRPFIITRSSYAGSGMYTSVWSGDNYSTWAYLRYALVNIYNAQMFGMPLSGADICGFAGNTGEELCARWMQSGAFYPFTRNHNTLGARDQEPYVFGEKVAMASRNAIRQKYSVLHYYYTKLYEVSLNGGSMFNPLFFAYPADENAYQDRNDTYMIGEALLIAPVLYKGKTKVTPYLPNANWYHLRNRRQLVKYSSTATQGSRVTLEAGFDFVNVLLRGGYIVPFQDAVAARVRRTSMLRVLPLEIVVAPCEHGRAKGTLIVDDGDSVNPIENKAFRRYFFKFSKDEQTLMVKVLNDYANHFAFEKFARLTILGMEQSQNFSTACVERNDGSFDVLRGTYDSLAQTYTYQKNQAQYYWSDIKKIRFASSCTGMSA